MIGPTRKVTGMSRSLVVRLSRDHLVARRDAICAHLGIDAAELERRAERYEVSPEEWAAVEELREIGFLLGDE